MRMVFDGVSAPVAIEDSPAILRVLSAIMPTWPRREINTRRKPVISVRKPDRRYRIDSPWLEQTADDKTAVGAACCVSIDLAHAFADNDPSRLCLHCAAVEVGNRLIVFPSTVRAGKSTLTARLASLGLRVFADDALPVDAVRMQGISLGIAPRLRWPLPAGVSGAFRNFCEVMAGPSDYRYRYLTLPQHLLASYGSRARIGAFVLLDRREAHPAELIATRRGEGLQQLLQQNFADRPGALITVDRLHRLIARTPCFTLIYSDMDEAAQLIRDQLHPGKRLLKQTRIAPRPKTKANGTALSTTSAEAPSRRRGGEKYFTQRPGVHLRSMEADLFLVLPRHDGVFRLNPVAAAVWRMLARPITAGEAADVLSRAFADTPVSQIRKDVRAVIRALTRADLIREMRVRSKPNAACRAQRRTRAP